MPPDRRHHRPQDLPEGFRYRAGLIAPAAETALLEEMPGLPFREFAFHGFTARRRVVSFGWRYDFEGGGLQEAEQIPGFLLPLRAQAGAFAGVAASDLQHVMVTEYRPGAAIGWHRDRSVFGQVVGISLRSPATFRFRKSTDTGWQRASLLLEPRSVYLLDGPARSAWEHSIPAVGSLRYSITFRSMRTARPRGTRKQD